MAAAYHFFKNKLLKGTDLNDNPVNPTKVLSTLEQRLQVVMINLGDDDDPYLIFESLNFKGEPLTQADLVRNCILMRFRHSISTGGEQERVHSKYWIPLEKMLELEKCLRLVESFIVRRAVCGVPTNSLNKLFIQLAKNFPDADHTQWLHRSLSSFSGNRRFPKIAEFMFAFMNLPQYGSRTTRFILCRLEKSFNHKETVDLSTATIEHVLPQTLTKEWKDELGAEAEKVHRTLVNTFGNLTLTGYNSELSNLPFSKKKAKLKNTHIELNRWILEQENWRASEIQERAKSLLLIANQIWPSPSDI